MQVNDLINKLEEITTTLDNIGGDEITVQDYKDRDGYLLAVYIMSDYGYFKFSEVINILNDLIEELKGSK